MPTTKSSNDSGNPTPKLFATTNDCIRPSDSTSNSHAGANTRQNTTTPKHLPAQYILMVHQTSRYTNDRQHQVESIPRLRHLIIVSLHDNASSNHLNLSKPSCCIYWAQAIQQGKVAAVIAHPPADTWNILRTTRSSTDHWGQPNHSAAKLAKIANFN